MQKPTLETILGEGAAAIVGDGGTGTMLQRVGLARGECPELWNVDPKRIPDVGKVSSLYLESGARVVETNTFGGNRYRLPDSHRGRVAELCRAGAAIARAQVDSIKSETTCLVAGSIGPTGKLLAPLGDLAASAAVDAFAEQAAALVAGGADLLLIETMTAIEEVRAAIEGAKRGAPGTPVAVTMSFGVNKRNVVRTPMGVSPEQLAQVASELGISWIGHNCGSGPAESEAIATELVKASRPRGIRVIVQSNAGLPRVTADGVCHYDATPAEMADHAKKLVAIGCSYIGGCCGTDPTHIRAISEALSSK